MPRVARNFRFFADRLLELEAEGDATFNGNHERFTCVPSGVTAVIGPWNAPLMLATWRISRPPLPPETPSCTSRRNGRR